MKIFHCDHCGQLIHFENSKCVSCGHLLAYLPDLGVVGSLEPLGDGSWQTPIPRAKGRKWRLCANYREHNVCNWAVSADDHSPFCASCRTTRTIPDLTLLGNYEAWYKLEVAKRRLFFSLMYLGLPVVSRSYDPDHGLTFEFLADYNDYSNPVLTGHHRGVITINLAEADDAERERRRVQLREPFRTLLGHFRHEVGHYYWDRLVGIHNDRLYRFRALFGDERQDYAAALQKNYEFGPKPDWQSEHVSAYASVHPWEDWAETWAHYLHITDALDTAAATGVRIVPNRPGDPELLHPPTLTPGNNMPFEKLLSAWYPLAFLLNNMNRGLGLRDAYPFVLSTKAVQKLSFIHETVAEVGRTASEN